MEIEAKKDLHNGGRCFTKGERYDAGYINNLAALIETTVVNDQGEKHCIGMWWRDFKLVNK